MSKLSDALEAAEKDELVFTGSRRGAYVDEAYTFEGLSGAFSLQDVLEYVYEMAASGGGAADGDGIYDGSGNVPANTLATVQGLFRIESESPGSAGIMSRIRISKLSTSPVEVIQFDQVVGDSDYAGLRVNKALRTILRSADVALTLQTLKGIEGEILENAPLLATGVQAESGDVEFANYALPGGETEPGEGNKIIEWQDGEPVFIDTPSGGGGASFDALTSGTVTAQVTRFGGTATTIANPAAGEYNLVVQSGAHLNAVSLYGNNTTLNGSNEMIIRVNNSANTRDRRVLVQLFDANNGALVDQQVTATVHTVVVSGNVTTITIPGLNGFGAAGFYVEIR